MQLVQLQQAQRRFKDQGIGLAAISYDSEAILKDFAERQHITFPLLADPQSEIIRKYEVLNTEARGMQQGMALPGFFYIDFSGRIKEKFFEDAYTDRYTANNVIAKIFPELTEQVARKVDAAHIGLTLQQSDQVVVPGSHLALIAEVSLGRDLHVYAPGVKGYLPIELKVEPAAEVKLDQSTYPQPKILWLKAINERVPVFEGKFRITQDVTVSANRDFIRSLGQGKTISLQGELKYQACDKTTCYIPISVPVGWEVHVVPLDFQRSPEAIQHRPSPK
jgi:hypothetical protein